MRSRSDSPVPTRKRSNASSDLTEPHALVVLCNASVDRAQVRPRPVHSPGQTITERHFGFESKLAPRFLRAAEPLARVIPIATWPDHERRLAAGDRHDLIRQLSDRRLDAAGEVVDVAWIAAERACQQPP